MEASCPTCGSRFACSPGAECWCGRLPLLPMPEGATHCLCPACLDRKLDEAAAKTPANTAA